MMKDPQSFPPAHPAAAHRGAGAFARARAAVLCSAVLGACSVGPRYVAPAPPDVAAYKEASAALYRGGDTGAWQPAQPQDAALKGKWWQIFHEPELDALEERLNIDNQNIAQFFQNFMAARAQVREARAGYFPTVTIDPSATRSRLGALSGTSAGGAGVTSGVAAGSSTTGAGTTSTTTANVTTSGAATTSAATTRNVYSLPLDVSWAPDLWDRVGNTVREYRYAAQVSAADLENERLTEQASLAQYFFELRGQDALQDLYDRTVDADRQALEFARAQATTGIGNDEAVAQAEVTLENARATGIGIATNRALYEHAIATLIGAPASRFSMPVRGLTTALPAIPVGVPSQLLQRRPDIAAAERAMAQANALIGVEQAAYYPDVVLTGSTGLTSPAISRLFSLPAFFWSIGASASETIFEGGLRQATVAQYTAQYNADLATYRQTVLTAIQQVEDYVATLRVISRQLARQEAAVQAARRYLDIATRRYETGLDPYLNVISAQTTVLADEQTLITLRVNEMTAAAQLVQALGGGWDAATLASGPDGEPSDGKAK
jgi:NodT family efflux transporter outer membrane factor (OMF) lipoprotein